MNSNDYYCYYHKNDDDTSYTFRLLKDGSIKDTHTLTHIHTHTFIYAAKNSETNHYNKSIIFFLYKNIRCHV